MRLDILRYHQDVVYDDAQSEWASQPSRVESNAVGFDIFSHLLVRESCTRDGDHLMSREYKHTTSVVAIRMGTRLVVMRGYRVSFLEMLPL